ncbi:hypothetical protein Taro_023927, partial [Colocasia esculenta]|nr:hypothetical protein [Colocasia esculenta]
FRRSVSTHRQIVSTALASEQASGRDSECRHIGRLCRHHWLLLQNRLLGGTKPLAESSVGSCGDSEALGLLVLDHECSTEEDSDMDDDEEELAILTKKMQNFHRKRKPFQSNSKKTDRKSFPQKSESSKEKEVIYYECKKLGHMRGECLELQKMFKKGRFSKLKTMLAHCKSSPTSLICLEASLLPGTQEASQPHDIHPLDSYSTIAPWVRSGRVNLRHHREVGEGLGVAAQVPAALGELLI